ncbi:MAG: hypothetical protein ACREBE_28095 [bacterium]
MPEPVQHKPLEQHAHVHDGSCGHATVPHEDHVDYLHDGHVHLVHGDHVDEEVAAPDAHLAHAGHMHVHDDGCGHPIVAHEGHVDYLHGDHRHTGHDVHYDEH